MQCPFLHLNRVYTSQKLTLTLYVHFELWPKRLSASSNNLDLWKGKRVEYFTPLRLFHKSLGLATVVPAGSQVLKEHLNWNAVWGVNVGLGCYQITLVIDAFFLFFLVVFSFVVLHFACAFELFPFPWKNNTAHCCVLRGQRFIGQDTRADLWYVWCGSDPNDHLVNIWCCLTGMSGPHYST